MPFSQRNRFLRSAPLILLGKWLDFVHRLAVLCRSEPTDRTSTSPPRRVLLSNCGALGDVTMCAQMILAIKRHFPCCRLGFIVHKDSAPALQLLPPLDWVHVSTSAIKPDVSLLKKFLSMLRFSLIEQPVLVREIKTKAYDCAIELRPFFPNMIPVFWKAKIPLRIGFASGGNSFLLNAACLDFKEQYIPLNYRSLLKKIGIFEIDELAFRKPAPVEEALDLPSRYFVFHLCSSNPKKNFPLDFWKTLYGECQKQGLTVYFSGKGEQDRQMISQVIEDPTYNLCNKLSWLEFAKLIRQSRGLVSVDSAAVHLAAYFHTPCAVLYKVIEGAQLWHPPLPNCAAFGLNGTVATEDILRFLENQ